MADDDLDGRIDALYAGPPQAFTAGRDALTRGLRAAGDRDRAERVRVLRRPTRIAAELNRLARRWPAGVDAVIGAQDALAAAQRAMLAGGGPDGLRAAEAEEARAVAGLTDDPETRAALRFAARSDRDRGDLRRGRLSRDPVADPAAGLFGSAPTGAGAPAPVARPPRPAPPLPGEDELALARQARERQAHAAAERERAREQARVAAEREGAAAEAFAAARRGAEAAIAEREGAVEKIARRRRDLERAERDLVERDEAVRDTAAALAGAEARADEAIRAREAAERAIPPD